MNKRTICYVILIVLNLCLVLFFGRNVGMILWEYHTGDQSYERLAETCVKDHRLGEKGVSNSAIDDPNHVEKRHEEEVPITVSFPDLQEQCSDAVAWLYCEGTPINYPIVQSEDNDFYMYRLPDGTQNPSGSFFLDYKNTGDFSDWNSIIYGHNMKNGSMFGILDHYRDPSYYAEHPVWYLLTPSKNYQIDLIGGYTTSGGALDTYKSLSTIEERDQFIEQIKRRTTFQTDVTIGDQEKLITCSTCIYDYENARYVLIGVLRIIDA